MVRNFPMQKADTHSMVAILKQLFSQHGLPEKLVKDNGSKFISETFQLFCSSCCITHVSSLPYHLQSNDQAEHFVDTFNHALLKAKGEGTTIEEILNAFLLSDQRTPNATVKNRMSSAEALMGRKLWTTVDALYSHKQ